VEADEEEWDCVHSLVTPGGQEELVEMMMGRQQVAEPSRGSNPDWAPPPRWTDVARK